MCVLVRVRVCVCAWLVCPSAAGAGVGVFVCPLCEGSSAAWVSACVSRSMAWWRREEDKEKDTGGLPISLVSLHLCFGNVRIYLAGTETAGRPRHGTEREGAVLGTLLIFVRCDVPRVGLLALRTLEYLFSR